MAQRAYERIQAEAAEQRKRAKAEHDAYLEQLRAAQQDEHDAGPPGGCTACWSWDYSPWADGYTWGHGHPAIQPGPPPDGYGTPDDWCYHPCHGDDVPAFCGLIAMAQPERK